MQPIDWSQQDKFSEMTNECRCGATFRSHSKLVRIDDGAWRLITRKPCPVCGSVDNVRSSRSDVEVY
jgi:hypothetical protein